MKGRKEVEKTKSNERWLGKGRDKKKGRKGRADNLKRRESYYIGMPARSKPMAPGKQTLVEKYNTHNNIMGFSS